MKQLLLVTLSSVHLAATVIWIGGMAMNLLVVMPAARKSLAPDDFGAISTAILARFAPFVYASIGLLALTGYWMARLHPIGMEAPEATVWNALLVAKHVLSALMGIIALLVLLYVAPRIRRLSASGRIASANLGRSRRLQMRLVRFNLFLGLVVLVLSTTSTRL